MYKRLRIGILGCAQIAERFVIPAMQALPEQFEVVGVASRSEAKVHPYAEKLGIRPLVGYEALLDIPGLDAVYVPLPNGLHAEWIEKALYRDLHVLVEKSLACTLEDVIRLNKLAATRNLALVENFQFRMHPQLKVIQDLLASGRIGDLRCVRSSFGFPPFLDSDNIRYDSALGGGALLDAGAYTLKISQILLGLELSVSAANLVTPASHTVDIWGGAYLQQKDGLLFSEVAFGFDQQYKCSLELWGSKGCLTTQRLFTAPPGYTAEIHVESGIGHEVIKVDPANHFENMLLYFYLLANGQAYREGEYAQNINQSRLIAEVFSKASNKV